MEKIRNFFKDESGATMVEYGLMVALVAVIVAVGAGALGTAVNDLFGTTATTVSGS
jgi:pilus assembly protein Flp/PilA